MVVTLFFWRQNTGKKLQEKDIKNMGVKNWTPNNVKYFPWDLESNKYFVDKYGFDLLEFEIDNEKSPMRYYAKWSRK